MTIPGDFSSAAFIIVGASITAGSDIKILHTGINPTRTGLIDALCRMGAAVTISGKCLQNGELIGDIGVISRPLAGILVNGPLVIRMIDEFPAFTTAAVFATGKTCVSDAGELRHKESDRITSLVDEFRSLGSHIAEYQDGYIIDEGNHLSGGNVQAHNDHRLAMALAIAGLAACSPVTIQGAEVISESYPGFIETLQHLGAHLSLEAV